jgi:phytoene dehydrogenase-like protein
MQEVYYPNIREIIEFIEVATPKQFFRIPKVQSDKIDNLYFAGQFVISGGFSATILSGFMCYEKILKDF